MASKRHSFNSSGPLYLLAVDWENVHHRRSVAACLVQGSYVLERDRQKKRQGPNALAPRWWESFHFQLEKQLVDDEDSCIFGAIYKYKPPYFGIKELKTVTEGAPEYVIAFRGTITKGGAALKDLKLDLQFLPNRVHLEPRFLMAVQEVENLVASCGSPHSKIWIAGHSLGSAMALFAGKNMAKTGINLKAFLFNPPFVSLGSAEAMVPRKIMAKTGRLLEAFHFKSAFPSAPIEWIKAKKMKAALFTSGVIKAGVTIALTDREQRQQADELFDTLSGWIPSLFVHPDDRICSKYISYFEDRKTMEDMGVGDIGRLATQNSKRSQILNACGKKSEPMHLLPSVSLTINQAHGHRHRWKTQPHELRQWWKPESELQLKIKQYRYTSSRASPLVEEL